MKRYKINAAFVMTLLTLTLVLTIGKFESKLPVHYRMNKAHALTGYQPTHIADVAERVLPSVVNISMTKKVSTSYHPFGGNPFGGNPFDHFFRRPHRREHRQRGQGSGVVISSDGVVITNNHVVKDAESVKVTLSDKRSFDAKVLGTDPKSDLAVIKLKGAKGLRPISIGNSKDMRLGEVVLAVGNPFGIGQTVTMGIVSAKGRNNVGIVDYEDFIQTDAAINPGNSGGALVNMKGELVGINTAILSRSGGYQGIGFAIPTDLAKPIIQSLRKSGKVTRGYIGVMIQDVNRDMAKAIGLPHKNGVLISDVMPNGPASRGGIKRGDFILSINGKKTPSAAALRNLVASTAVSSSARFELIRNKRKIGVNVKIGELPSEKKIASAYGNRSSSSPSGLDLAPLNRRTRQYYRLPSGLNSGIVVKGIKRNTKAASAGLRSGDVILEANRVRIKSVEQFNEIYRKASNSVLLLVHRKGSTIFLLLSK